MHAEIVILLAIVGILLISALYSIILMIFKYVRHSPAVIFRWRYYRLTAPFYQTSKYYDKYSLHVRDYIAYCPTIDDSIMMSVASQLRSHMEGMSGKRKASFLLAFTQQNVRYVSDQKQYNETEHWALL